MKRKQQEQILADLERKIVFLVGPRQVGKTWLAKEIGRTFRRTTYLNWDSAADRMVIKGERWPRTTELLILDEIHKMKGWKGFLKGVFDTRPEGLRILVTGSARLDFVRPSGPSLAGRFLTHRLLPFAPAELAEDPLGFDLDRFERRGGFPEPFLAADEVEADRWRAHYLDGLLREDVPDFERVNELRAMELLVELLRNRVGVPVSCESLAREAAISPNTVRKYLRVLEALYLIFRVSPFSHNIARSLLKNPKIYFFDTGMVKGDAGSVFENFAAVCLLKHALGRTDLTGRDGRLQCIRTKDGREVDFCLVVDGRPEVLIEAKHGEADFARPLAHFSRALGIPGIQVVKELRHEQQSGRLELRSAASYFRELGA
jgi:predicted AAA+ superfamily ATPase